jgi:hypothetical protein
MPGFSHDFVRVFAFTQTDELRVSQVIGFGPLQELDLSRGFAALPRRTPSSSRQLVRGPIDQHPFRQIHEWALCRLQCLNLLEYLAPSQRHEAGASPRSIVQLLAAIDSAGNGDAYRRSRTSG